MTSTTTETEDNERLRKAKELVEHCKSVEAEAIRQLASARQSLTSAREKYEALFKECESRAVARRKSGAVINNPGY